MERFLGDLLDRGAAHSSRNQWLFASLAVVGLLQLPSAGVGLTYFDFSWADTAAWFAVAAVATILAIGVAFASARDLLAPVDRWRAGDRSDPDAALASLSRMPPVLGQRSTVALAVAQVGVTYPVGIAVSDVGWQGGVGLGLASLYLAFTGGVFIAWGTQLLVLRTAPEVLAAAPRLLSFEVRGWSLRMRLVSLSACTVALSCVGVTALVLRGDADEGHYLAAVVGAGLLAAYGAWVIDSVVRPTLAPLFEIVAGAERVGRGDLSAPVAVSSLDEIGGLATAFNRMQKGLAEREALHAAFGTYVDPTLAQRIVDSGSAVFEGEDVVVTVLFADVRDFTTLAEAISPGEALALLNDLFDAVVPVLRAHGGHANHYLGDGLLAVFGAPERLEGHADHAVAAAVAIQQVVRERFGSRLRLGIGINTGPVIAGTVGGGGRLEFTVIGDTVNVASRVEQLTKETGDAVLVTDATRDALSTPRPRTTPRGAFDLKGKTAQVVVHSVSVPRAARG